MADEQPLPGQRIDTSDPVVAKYLRERARETLYNGEPNRQVSDPMSDSNRGLITAAGALSPALGAAAMKLAQRSEDLSRAGDHVGAKQAARSANRIVIGAVVLFMTLAAVRLALLWFAG